MDQKIKQDICIGTNLKRLRQQKSMTQDQVATQLQLRGFNLSRDFYAHLENGSYNIRTSELLALKAIFGCTFDDFFQGLSLDNED